MGLTNQLSDQLVNITPTTMVYGTLIARATGFLNQLIMFGGPTLYPMLICYISIEHGHLKLIFHPPKNIVTLVYGMVIFILLNSGSRGANL